MLALEYRQCLCLVIHLNYSLDKYFRHWLLLSLKIIHQTPSFINHHTLLFPLSSSVTLLINIWNSICSFRNITFTNQTNYLFYNTLILLSEAKHAERHLQAPAWTLVITVQHLMCDITSYRVPLYWARCSAEEAVPLANFSDQSHIRSGYCGAVWSTQGKMHI